MKKISTTSSSLLLHSLCLLFFIGVAYLYYGRGIFSAENIVYGDGGDPLQYYWYFKWWSYALDHPVHFFLSQKVWPPAGYNITQATSLLGAWLLSLPLQYFFSALASLNIIAVFTPALAAWTMYFFAFDLSKEHAASLIAGMLFGFSAYMSTQMLGHLNLTASVFILPMLTQLVWRLTEQKINRPLFTVCYALLFTLLFLISKEIAYTSILAGGISLLIAKRYLQWEWCHLKPIFLTLLAAYAFSGLMLTPYLYHFFSDSITGHITGTSTGNNILGFFSPSSIFYLSPSFSQALASNFSLAPSEQNAYLGLPLIALVILLFAKQDDKYTRFIFITACVFMLISLGGRFDFAELRMNNPIFRTIWLHFPFLKSIMPSRIVLYGNLALSALVAINLAKQEGQKRVLLFTLSLVAILFLVPTQNRAHFPRYTELSLPAFFDNKQRQYERYLSHNEHVLLLTEAPSLPLFYQAKTNFYFTLVNALLGRTTNAADPETTNAILQLHPLLLTKVTFAQFVSRYHVDSIIIQDPVYSEWAYLLPKSYHQSAHTGGVYLYKKSLPA
jgi:hypothetical protein